MYDIIGDIHGHAKKLEELLLKMGYKNSGGVYEHSSRQCVFLGDFIDRGPEIRKTLQIVKSMCDSGNALAIIGNHEFNAIGFHTINPEGGFFRNHHFAEINQHYKTLEQFKDYPSEWNHYLDWFHRLPLFMEFESFRVIHACWDSKHIEWIKQNEQLLYQSTGSFSNQLLKDYHLKEDPIYTVIDELLKGKEFPLPDQGYFIDEDGHIRHKARFKWWMNKEDGKTNKDVFLGIDEEFGDKVINLEVLNTLSCYDEQKVVFFGHYWLKGIPRLTGTKAICLDFSAAKNGYLTAYRWDDNGMHENNLIYV